MKQLIIVASLFIMHLCYGQITDAQTGNIDSLEIQIRTIEMELDSLQSVKTVTLQQANDLIQRIDLLRDREPLSRNEHHDLEKLMQESQKVESRVVKIDEKIEDCMRRQETSLQSIVVELQRRITDIVQTMEASGSKNHDLASQLQDLIDKKEDFKTRIQSRPPEGFVFEVNAESWDTPNRLRMKGDMLLDQEEAVREEISRVDKRIASLIDEEKVRRKVSELVSEMDIFDENEELFGRETAVLEGAADAGEVVFNEVRGEMSIQAWSPESLGAISSRLTDEMTAPAPRSADRIRDWISRLQTYRAGLNARADSLGSRAQWFHDEADKNRD